MVLSIILSEINELNGIINFEFIRQTRLSHLDFLRLMLTPLRIGYGLLEPLRMTQIKQTSSAEETAVTSVMSDSVNALGPQITILLWLLSSADKMPLKTILIAILPAFISGHSELSIPEKVKEKQRKLRWKSISTILRTNKHNLVPA